MSLRLGTRGSALALAQARWVAARLAELGQACEIVVIATSGDRDTHSPFAAIGAPGIFVREIEAALLDERIDVAVHCYKDLPSTSPVGLEVLAMPEREDPRDVLVARHERLPERAVVGTSSARRRALVADMQPAWSTRELRGNVPTRLDKLRSGAYDAIVLAQAGLSRLARVGALDLGGLFSIPLDPRRFVPAPSQGALALQARSGDRRAAPARALDLPEQHALVRAEREFLRLADAGCDAVVGAHAERGSGGRIELVTLRELDGRRILRSATGTDPLEVAARAFTEGRP